MKIALCLSGTVGKIYTNKKQYEYDQDVDYRIGLEHYKRHLFKHNDVDVFMHCWDKKYEKEIVKVWDAKTTDGNLRVKDNMGRIWNVPKNILKEVNNG